MATFGPQIVIAQEFAGIARADMVILFGSWARRLAGEVGREPGDVDVMVIGSPDRDAVYAAAERAEVPLNLPVGTTVRSATSWEQASDALVITAKRDAVVVLPEGPA